MKFPGTKLIQIQANKGVDSWKHLRWVEEFNVDKMKNAYGGNP